MHHKTTETLLTHFNRIRGDRAVPLRSEIDPSAMKGILPDLFILEAGRDGMSHFRLAGTRICSILGRELRGEDFEMIWCKTDRHKMRLANEAVLASQSPGLVSLRALNETDAALHLEMLLLPLSSRPGITDRVLGSLVNIQAGYVNEEHRQLRADAITYLSTELRGTAFIGAHARSTHALPAGHLDAPPIPPPGKRWPFLRVLEGGKR